MGLSSPFTYSVLGKHVAHVHRRSSVLCGCCGEGTGGAGDLRRNNDALLKESDGNNVPPRSLLQTGMMDMSTTGATRSFVQTPLVAEKQVVFVRHGMSTWNEEKRIQGSSEIPTLTEFGELQALKCEAAVSRLHFDNCFSSPISRARKTAELMWMHRDGEMIFLNDLKEADLGRLQGLKNSVAAVEYKEYYRAWRDHPEDFSIDGRYPISEVFEQAERAWQRILSSDGISHLVVTHKSILRAMLCAALGLGPGSFRSVDVNNGGICVFRINKEGEPMLTALNLTSHLHAEHIYY